MFATLSASFRRITSLFIKQLFHFRATAVIYLGIPIFRTLYIAYNQTFIECKMVRYIKYNTPENDTLKQYSDNDFFCIDG